MGEGWRMRGFTLLEMLFVLFVVALIFGMIAPRVGPQIDNYELLSQRQDMEDQLRQLPRRVRLTGRSVELPGDIARSDLGDGAPALKIPDGWVVEFTPPLTISRGGACSPSTVRMAPTMQPAASVKYKISELTCELAYATS